VRPGRALGSPDKPFCLRAVAEGGESTRLLYVVVRRWWVLRSVTECRSTKSNTLLQLWRLPDRVCLRGSRTDPNAQVGAIAVNEIDWFNIAIKLRGSEQPCCSIAVSAREACWPRVLAALPFRPWALLILVTLKETKKHARGPGHILGAKPRRPSELAARAKVAAAMPKDLVACPSVVGSWTTRTAVCVLRAHALRTGLPDTVSN